MSLIKTFSAAIVSVAIVANVSADDMWRSSAIIAKNDYNASAVIYDDYNVSTTVGFIYHDRFIVTSECKNKGKAEKRTLVVNGKSVKALSICVNNNLSVIAETGKGREFIINEFRMKNWVELYLDITASRPINFSANGFVFREKEYIKLKRDAI